MTKHSKKLDHNVTEYIILIYLNSLALKYVSQRDGLNLITVQADSCFDVVGCVCNAGSFRFDLRENIFRYHLRILTILTEILNNG
jgi:hypothetical protein